MSLVCYSIYLSLKGPNLTEHSVEMEAQTGEQCILLYTILVCPILNIYSCYPIVYP